MFVVHNYQTGKLTRTLMYEFPILSKLILSDIVNFKCVSASYARTVFNQPICSYKIIRSTVFGRHNYDLDTNYQDTISEDDDVRKQYLSLPYLAVPKHYLEKEKGYYDSDRSADKPFSVPYAWTLENLNHFLFEGKNHFR